MVQIKTGYRPMKDYEAYKKAFPFLDAHTYNILALKGCLGALRRGEKIELKEEGILIEYSWVRQELSKIYPNQI